MNTIEEKVMREDRLWAGLVTLGYRRKNGWARIRWVKITGKRLTAIGVAQVIKEGRGWVRSMEMKGFNR